MASRPQTPSHEIYGSAPSQSGPSALAYRNSMHQQDSYLAPGTTVANDYAHMQGAPNDASPLHHGSRFNEEWDMSQRGSSLIDGGAANANMHRSDSVMSQSQTVTPSRGGTLKKKNSLSKKGSLRRSGSRRSSRAGSVRSVYLGEKEKYDPEGDEHNSAFYTPVPTSGNPTDILAHRFQDWRKVLKDLITYFKDIQKSYETRSKSLVSASNTINNIATPPSFLSSGGIGDATGILGDFHKQSLNAATRAKEIEGEVILQLTGLRSDLQQKIKEIKSLSGDFKNSVEKETDSTRKAVRSLQESLGLVDSDPHATSGKGDPFLVKLSVDRQLEKQIEEENYLHRAYLNLESSGRELESIVVGEIQKAYNAYAGIIKREADEAYETVEKLRDGPISIAKDHEWTSFVETNDHMVDPRVPLRNVEQIYYPGKQHPAAAEVRAGMLERKSKYLKSYTPGWYVLSPTHLHEFKSADRISVQAPVMSLYLPEQKLGSHSQGDSSSHKFMLKGRQTGSMHRGHAWVFRAESHDTMLAWYEDIKNLTEKTGEDRNAFVRRHARSFSGASKAGSISSEGAMDEDEADETPYAADAAVMNAPEPVEHQIQRPQPGGRFPSDIQVNNRNLQAPLSPSSGESSGERDALAAAGALPGSGIPFAPYDQQQQQQQQPYYEETGQSSETPAAPLRQATFTSINHDNRPAYDGMTRHDSHYGNWMAPAAGGAVAGIAGTEAYQQYQQRHPEPESIPEDSPVAPAQPQSEQQPAELGPGASAPDVYSAPTVITNVPAAIDDTEQTPNAHPESHTESVSGQPITTNSPTSLEPSTNTLTSTIPSSVASTSDPDSKRPDYRSQDSGITVSDLVRSIPGGYPKTPRTSMG